MFYVEINIALFKREGELHIRVHRLIPDDISIEQQLTNIMNVFVKYYDKSRFESYV